METASNHPFLSAAKAKGASDEGLIAMLVAAGKSERQAREELLNFYAAETGLNPATGPADRASNPLDGFFYAGSSVALIWWVTAALALIWSLVDLWMPDALTANDYGRPSENLVFPLASIIVCVPLYLIFMAALRKRLANGWSSFRSPIRLWSLSLTLLVGLAVSIGYLVWGVFLILSSGMTPASALKLGLSILLLGTVILGYLAWLRHDPHQEQAR